MILRMPKLFFARSAFIANPVACAALQLLASISWATAVSPEPAPTLHSRVGWPLFFELAAAQPDSPQSMVARGPNYLLRISANQVDFLLRKPQPATARDSLRRDEAARLAGVEARLVQVSFVSASSLAVVNGVGELEGKVNYLLGNDPTQWRSQVPIFSKAEVRDLYPGINLLYYGNGQQLEYDFTIAPKADPSLIRLHFDGVDRLSVNPQGELIVGLGEAELRQHRPVIYQLVGGVRREVSGGYRMADDRTVCFTVGKYNPDFPLIIDPAFTYSTYLGGNGGDTGLSIKVDKNGSVYLAGETLSSQFPPAQNKTPFQSQFHGGTVSGDAFVAKLDNTGLQLLYLTYLGGSGDDGAYDLAIDANGNAYITGFTVSADFPTKNAIYNKISGTADVTFHVYPYDAFVAELNTNGSALVYSTFLGGTDKDLGSAIAVDPAGYAYVTGYTYSTNFPILNAAQKSMGGVDDVFVAKLAPGGTHLVYSTYLGGLLSDEGEGIATDAAGYAYVTGYTTSTNFPVTPQAWQTLLNGTGASISVYDAFLARFAPDGKGPLYSTFLGGGENDFGYRIAVANSGDVFVSGITQSTNFFHTNAFGLTLGENGTNAVNFDAFLTRFDPAGIPRYSAQFGGTGNDIAWDVAVDSIGRAFVVGTTLSTNFPFAHQFGLFRSSSAGGKDVFVVVFNTNAEPVLLSAYLGGSADDFGYAIAVDSEANFYISGMTLSPAFPTTTGALSRSLSGSSDSFVAKIRLADPVLSVDQSTNGFQLSWPATAPDYSLQSTTDLSPPQTWVMVPQVPVLADGQYLVTIVTTNAATLFRLVHK